MAVFRDVLVLILLKVNIQFQRRALRRGLKPEQVDLLVPGFNAT